MSEKAHMMPNAPEVGSNQMQQAPPPPYSPYSTGPAELDASKPYPPMPEEIKDAPVGFQVQQPPVVVQSSPPASQTILHSTHVVPLGPKSVRMTCPFCHADMETSTTKENTVIAYISAAVCCLVGCIFGCCLIPFCMDSCKKTEHHCPNCKRFIGKYSHY